MPACRVGLVEPKQWFQKSSLRSCRMGFANLRLGFGRSGSYVHSVIVEVSSVGWASERLMKV